MDRCDQLVEHVAQQFYATLEAAQPWISASETLKEEFRSIARKVMKLVAERQTEGSFEPMEQIIAVISSLN